MPNRSFKRKRKTSERFGMKKRRLLNHDRCKLSYSCDNKKIGTADSNSVPSLAMVPLQEVQKMNAAFPPIERKLGQWLHSQTSFIEPGEAQAIADKFAKG